MSKSYFTLLSDAMGAGSMLIGPRNRGSFGCCAKPTPARSATASGYSARRSGRRGEGLMSCTFGGEKAGGSGGTDELRIAEGNGRVTRDFFPRPFSRDWHRGCIYIVGRDN